MNRTIIALALGLGLLVLGGTLYLFGTESREDDESMEHGHSQAHEKSAIIPEGTSPPIGPYTPAVKVGDMLFLSPRTTGSSNRATITIP